MHIAVLGAGVVGVATAWELIRDGHRVTVIDREDEAASFTSAANAGLVAPGHAYAWGSSRAPAMMLRSLWRNDQAIRYRPRLDMDQWRWVMAFLGQCNDQRASINTRRKVRLCIYSQSQLERVRNETALEYDRNDGGLLYFYRSEKSFASASSKCEILRGEGMHIEVLDRDGVVGRDPGLADARHRIAGGLWCRSDESGDAQIFTRVLKEKCETEGVEFRMNTAVHSLRADGAHLQVAETDSGAVQADAFVLALGVFSPELVRRLDIRLPIYPVKGYSVTLASGKEHQGPRLGGVDEDNLLAYCPMGDRLRLTATAEISDYRTLYRPADFTVMLRNAAELLPNAADYSRPAYWAGLRPLTPTGLPVISGTRFDNLWLNTGHGHMGWTMACGSARIVADQLAGRKPPIELTGMTLDTIGA